MKVTVILPQSSFDLGGITAGPGNPLAVSDLIDANGSLTPALPGRIAASFLGGTCKCDLADIDEDGSLTGIAGAMVSYKRFLQYHVLSLSHCFAVILGRPSVYFGSCREHHVRIGHH